METCYKAMRGELARSLVPRLTRRSLRLRARDHGALAEADARIFEVPISYSAARTPKGKKIGWRDGVAAFWHITKFNLFS